MAWDNTKQILRPKKNIKPFSADSIENERTIFGSTQFSNDLESNLSEEYELGWEYLEAENKTNPSMEDFNAVMFTNSLLTSYIFQQGVVEWSTNQSYFTNSIAKKGATLYKSLTGEDETPNIGNDPEEEGSSNWEKVLFQSVGGLSIGSIQQSMLTESQFQTFNGPEWVLWNSALDITGTALADALGTNTLADASGKVFRNVGGNAAPLGEAQLQDTAVNGLSAGAHSHSAGDLKLWVAGNGSTTDVGEA